MEELKARYASRIVVFDLPPLLAAADVLAFAPHIEAALLVVEEGKTQRDDIRRAAELLSSTHLIGTVLNKSDEPVMSVYGRILSGHGRSFKRRSHTSVYEAFYRFREKPFSILPDPSFLYLSPKHSTALALLEYGLMNQAGFNVITGEIGTGKTTLIRYLLSQMDRDMTVGLISNTHRSFGELLQWILFAFNLEHRGKQKVEMFQDFLDFLLQEYSQNRRTVLIVDEAQNMAPDTLEELRMLSNVNADKDQVLQLILVGQAELRETLRRPDMQQFAQRIVVDYHLEPLDRQETHAYIRHRIAVAGGHDPLLFDDAACDAVYRA